MNQSNLPPRKLCDSWRQLITLGTQLNVTTLKDARYRLGPREVRRIIIEAGRKALSEVLVDETFELTKTLPDGSVRLGKIVHPAKIFRVALHGHNLPYSTDPILAESIMSVIERTVDVDQGTV